MPAQQGIRRDHRVEFEQSFALYRLGLARQKRSLGVRKANPLTAQPFLEQAVFCLEKLDDDQLMTVNPARRNHQQKLQ